MAAGDLVLIGWDGSPLYKEVTAPTVAYEPLKRNESGDSVKKTVNRILHCRKKDVQTVLQGIIPTNATISYDSPDNGGGTTTVSYGSGWQLKQYGEAASALGNYYAEINLTYEKTGVTAFELGLPTGLTMNGAAGIGYIKYLGNVLFEFDSAGDDLGNMWGISELVSFIDKVYYERFSFSDSYTDNFGNEWPSSGSSSAASKDVPIMSCVVSFNGKAVKKIVSDIESYRDLDLTIQESLNTGYPSRTITREDGSKYTYPSASRTINFEHVDLDSVYKGLRWSVSGNIIKLLFWEITIFQWDVTGLTA